MEIVYADSLFFLNLAVDYLLCLAAARVCGLCLKRPRYIAAGALGGLYSVAVYLPKMGFLSSAPAKLLCALAMCLVAFGSERRPLRCFAVFLAVSAALGGGVWALSMRPRGAFGVYLPVSMRALLLSFALCYAGISLLFYCRARLQRRARERVELTFLGRSAEFFALCDSGNALTDPLTGCRVMVVCPHALRRVFGEEAALFELTDAVALLEAANAVPELRGRLRLIPYGALGGGGLLPVFRPEALTIGGREERELLAAVSPQAAGDGFEAIIPV